MVLFKMSSVISVTPRILGKEISSKSSRKGRIIKILADFGATMTLIHARTTRRLGLKVSTKEGEQIELFNTHKSMRVKGRGVIYVIPEGSTNQEH